MQKRWFVNSPTNRMQVGGTSYLFIYFLILLLHAHLKRINGLILQIYLASIFVVKFSSIFFLSLRRRCSQEEKGKRSNQYTAVESLFIRLLCWLTMPLLILTPDRTQNSASWCQFSNINVFIWFSSSSLGWSEWEMRNRISGMVFF